MLSKAKSRFLCSCQKAKSRFLFVTMTDTASTSLSSTSSSSSKRRGGTQRRVDRLSNKAKTKHRPPKHVFLTVAQKQQLIAERDAGMLFSQVVDKFEISKRTAQRIYHRREHWCGRSNCAQSNATLAAQRLRQRRHLLHPMLRI